MTRYAFTILGAPRTKKNHGRRVYSFRLKRTVQVPSAAHERWYAAALPRTRIEWNRHAWPRLVGPVRVTAVFYRDRATGDLVGYMQALGDLLQNAGVIADDKLIASWGETRLDKDPKNPRVEVTISECDA